MPRGRKQLLKLNIYVYILYLAHSEAELLRQKKKGGRGQHNLSLFYVSFERWLRVLSNRFMVLNTLTVTTFQREEQSDAKDCKGCRIVAFDPPETPPQRSADDVSTAH